MTSQRAELTPQMFQYAERFDDRGEIRWLPYLMYFHPADHRSEVVNTDRLGFRVAHGSDGERASVGGRLPAGPVRLLAGSSTVFGIGATNDGATLPSRLWAEHAPSLPWLNFGGRSYNSTQEALLFVLYRHLLPRVDEVVLLSGFNDLGLARLPSWQQGDSGAFFNCTEWYEAMDELRARQGKALRALGRLTQRRAGPPADYRVPDLGEQIARAVDLTTRNLDTWRVLTDAMGARLTYVLQPLATWVREQPAREERLLFAELDEIADFGRAYGDIASMEAYRGYSESLQQACEKLGVAFLDLTPVLAGAIGPDDWVFVDRIHFNDEGYDLVAGLLARSLGLS